MSVYAYIRVSTEMQSHASQKHEITEYCRMKNIQIDRWVSESVSGTIAIEKRKIGKVFEKMKKGDMLICTELSRLGRNMLMVMSVLNKCSEKGITIQTIKDNFSLSDSINSKIIAFAFALAAEIERNLISQRTKEALAVKKLEGVRLGRPPGRSRKKEVFRKNYADIIHIYEEGTPLSQIAEKYGIHRNTVRKYLSEMGKIKKK
mgnify:CR=1 FL=1